MFPRKEQVIGVIGSGAIGGFYGGLLAYHGFDTHFLLRSGFSKVEKEGFVIKSKILGTIEVKSGKPHKSVEDMPRCDYVLLATKTISNPSIAPLVAAVTKPNGKVLVMQNGLHVEDQLRPLLPDSLHLIGALCWIGVQMEEHGIIDHIALGNVDLAYHSGPNTGVDQCEALLDSATAMFHEAEIEAAKAPSIAAARWKKLVWNVPFNGLSALLDAGTEALLRQPDMYSLVRAIMQEVLGGAAACGHVQSEVLVDRMIKLTQSIPDYLPSMLLDARHKRPMELDSIYATPIAEARDVGFSMPKTEALYQALRFLDDRSRSDAQTKRHL